VWGIWTGLSREKWENVEGVAIFTQIFLAAQASNRQGEGKIGPV
jgi:hypothetical protein